MHNDVYHTRVQAPRVTLFAAAMFVNALLLFFVQPMFAKMLLPLMGGSPAVWTTCMLFFQCALLVGYFYSHALGRVRSLRRQAAVHITVVILAGLVLPIGISRNSPDAQVDPIWWVLQVSIVSVAAPFIALATSAPLLQRWFSTLEHHRARDPYFLYTASNAGSLAALVLYPAVVEPTLAGRTQATLWAAGYISAALLTLWCALLLTRSPPSSPDPAATSDSHLTRIMWSQRLRWIALAFVPSSLMLAVTAYLSADVAPVPLLWTVPLALYLTTFIVVFSRAGVRALAVCRRVLPYTVLITVSLLVAQGRLPLFATVVVHLLGFSVLAMLCHGMLAADRPAPKHLTDFYLALATGGALGGVFNTLIAPRLFTEVWEYPIVLATGCLLLGIGQWKMALLASRSLWAKLAAVAAMSIAALIVSPTGVLNSPIALILVGVSLVVCFSVSRQPAQFSMAIVVLLVIHGAIGSGAWGSLLYSSRTFFGVYRVAANSTGELITLFHGTTVHGRQRRGLSRPEPLTYYHRESPIAEVLRSRHAGTTASIGAVGLGVGSLAAYVQPGQRWTFYEIDPEVERIARDSRYFTFLSACGAPCDVVIGDARLSLENSSATYDVLVLDAFSSDAIPVHLMTREAISTYLSRLEPGGVMAFHVSNNHIRLRPVLARLSRVHRLAARARFDQVSHEKDGRTSSDWVVLAREEADLGTLSTDPRWQPLAADSNVAWTDDFSNIWSAIEWRR
jgi:hypothetical protein